MFSNVHGAEVAGPPAPKNLTATPTSAPTPEISVDTEKQNPTDQGTLSKPDHPDTVSADKLVFIGDSRTEGLRDAVNDDSVWSCLSGKGYDWMVQTGVPQIEDEIEKNLLNTAISRLAPRERKIVELRYGLTNEDGEEMTQKEVADLMGISQSYISRLEKKIMKRLKKEIVRFE